MKPASFEYVAATSLDEALGALAGGGDDAKPIAGGQSLVPALNLRLVRPTLLVDLNRAGLDGIVEGERVTLGAMVRQGTAARDARVHPLLREALPHVGHVATRSRGTVGGSIAHADGAAELPVCLATLGGTIEIAGVSGMRVVDADAFFVTHYTTTLSPGELVTATTWPIPAAGEGFAFEELALRAGDYALSMVAVALRRRDGKATDVRVVAGAVTDRPTRLTDAEAALTNSPVDDAAIVAAMDAARAAVEPNATIHADAEYLRHVTGVLVARAVRRAWERTA